MHGETVKFKSKVVRPMKVYDGVVLHASAALPPEKEPQVKTK